jgi:hypothetical protein
VTRKGDEIQGWLVDYLNTGLDPYDIPQWYVKEWGEEEGIEGVDEDTHVDSLEPDQFEAYKKWLLARDRGSDWAKDEPFESAPYLHFSNAKALPDKTWCIHFTKATPFSAFDRGATLEGLHLSTWRRKKVSVDCDINLNFGLDVGPYEVVFGFAFEAREFVASPSKTATARRKYGDHAILFQVDCGISAWHSGDNEQQVIFPLCSEYNLVPVDLDTNGEVTTEDESGKAVVFPSLKTLIEKLDKRIKENPRSRKSRRFN